MYLCGFMCVKGAEKVLRSCEFSERTMRRAVCQPTGHKMSQGRDKNLVETVCVL